MLHQGYGFKYPDISIRTIGDWVRNENHKEVAAKCLGVDPTTLSFTEFFDAVYRVYESPAPDHKLVCNIIARETGLSLDVFVSNDSIAIMREDCQPWELSAEERNMSLSDVEKILNKYSEELPLGNVGYVKITDEDVEEF